MARETEPLELRVDEARNMLEDLIAEYKAEAVQQKFTQALEKPEMEAIEERDSFLLDLQIPIVSKYGFDASAKGVQDAMKALSREKINRDPDVCKMHNHMETLIYQPWSHNAPIDAYMPQWQMLDLRNCGRYRNVPVHNFPIIESLEKKSEAEGCFSMIPRAGIISAQDTEDLVTACRDGDVARANQLLGSRKVGASAKSLLLNVGYRSLGPSAAKTLAKALSKDLESLELDISGNNIGPTGAKAIADSLTLAKGLKLLKLNVAANRLGLEGVKALCAALPRDVEVLALGFAGMKMGAEGAKELALRMPPKVRELTLDLYGNNVTDEGVVAISRALPKCIEYLNVVLLGNQVSRRGFFVMDRQIGDPLNQYHLPSLTNENFKKVAEVEVFEFKEEEDGSLTRQLDFRSNF